MRIFSLLCSILLATCLSASAQSIQEDYPILSKKIVVIPKHAGEESSCHGYRGERLALRAAPNDDAAIVGYIENGDNLSDQYNRSGVWSFTETRRSPNHETLAIGWYKFFRNWGEKCAEIYG